jgi:hypothetical protein
MENFIKTHLQNAPAGSDQQLIWFQGFMDAASSPASVQYLRALLTGKQKLKGMTIDQEHQWELVNALARNGAKDARELIAAELKEDATDMGQKHAIAAEALIPDAISKSKWLTLISQGPSDSLIQETAKIEPIAATSPKPSSTPIPSQGLSLAKLREAMWNYQVTNQEEFTKASVDTYFNTLPKLALSGTVEGEEYSGWFAKTMFPSLCDSTVIQKTTALLNQYPNLPAEVVKDLKIGRQEEERCIRAREKAKGAS